MWDANQYAMPRVVAEAAEAARMKFIRNVYNLLLVSTGFSVLVGFITYNTPGLLIFAAQSRLFVVLGVLAILWLSAAVKGVRGASLGLLFTVTGLMGFATAPILFVYNQKFPGIGMEAALITLAVFAGLSCYVYSTRKDFSYLGGFLWAALLGLIVAGLIGIFFPFSRGFGLVYCWIGALLFAGYILYDTSNVLHHYTESQVPQAALALYIDLLNLFLFILRILGGSRRN